MKIGHARKRQREKPLTPALSVPPFALPNFPIK